MAAELEQALAALEQQVEAALKTTQASKTALGKVRLAAKSGALREIDRALAGALASATELGKRLEALQSAWTFDAEAYFADGRFQAELLQAARDAGLQLFEKDGRIYCYPMLLGVAPKDLALTIDRKPERRVRPAALAKLLAARQKAPQKFPVAQFLDTLFAAYQLLAPRLHPAWRIDAIGHGPVVPLADIYDTLTLLPGASRDYALPEFTRDIHLLDRSPGLRSKSGHRFSLPASTGSKTGKRLTMIDAHGTQHLYVGFAMHRE
jgi:hypothetical protein